jgi:recombinational DNA repair ATPase RecF
VRVELKHFGRHASLVIESDARVLLVVGKNRAGKTTVRDAVEFALLGTCALRGFELKKDVARHMIHGAAERASVELRVDRGGAPWAVRRTMRAGGAQKIELDRFGNGGWVEVSAIEWSVYFPADPRAVRAALDSDSFWRASADDRRRLLVSMKENGQGVTAETISAELATLAAQEPKSPRVAGLLPSLVGIAVARGFTSANAVAVESRRELKRALTALPDAPDPATVETHVGEVDCREGSLDDLRRGLAEAQAELVAAVEAKANSAGRLAERLAAARDRRATADEHWQGLGRRLLEEFAHHDPTEECRAYTAAELRDIERSKGWAVETAVGRLNELESKRADLRRFIESPMGPADADFERPHLCPAAPFKFPCPVKEDRWAKAGEQFAAQIAERAAAETAARAQAEADLAQLAPAYAEARDALATAKAAAKEAEDRAAAREKLDADLWHAKDAYDLAVVEEHKVERAADAAGEGPSDADLDFIRGRIAERAALIEQRERYEAAVALAAKTSRERSEIEACVAWVDEVERELRPEGVEGRLASQGRGRLAEVLDELGRVLGTTVEISPEFEVTIGGRHIAAASKSEQRVAGALIQIAIADRLNFPFVVVDEVDALDADWRDGFRRTMNAATQEVAAVWQVVALATTDAEPPGAPPEEWATAWVRPGHPVEMIVGE